MATDSIGSLSDSELIDVADQVVSAMTPDPAAYASTAGVVMALATKNTTFSGDVTDQIAKEAAKKAATSAKDASRAEVEAAIRSIRNIANANKVKQEDMDALGIPVSNNSAPSNATVPAGSVNTSERLRHTISWTDAASLDNKRKPRGVMGCEIWLKLDGPPPTDETQCTFLTLDAFTPYLAEYGGSDGGKMAHYMLRWRMRDGSVLAWGETVSATITG